MKIKHLPYPETERGNVTDNYFGTEVADPYRWLEDDNSEATAAWVKAENEVTFDYLSKIPFREAIKERLTELWDYPKESAPSKKGDWLYFSRNDGLQNQAVIYRRATPDAEAEVFLDPNQLSDDGTVALAATSFSKDGKYFAFATAASGSDWVEIHVMDTESKRQLDDCIKWVKISGATWAPDGKGFYYSGYDAPEKGVYSSKNEFQKVYYHKIGTPQSADRLIYSDPKHPLRYFYAWQSDDSRWIFVSSSEGTSGSEILYKRSNAAKFDVLLKGFDYDYSIVECVDDQLYVMSNEGAENYNLIKIDLNNPSKREVVIAEKENLLENVNSAGGCLTAIYLEDAQNKVYQYEMDGTPIREVTLPGIGTVSGFNGEKEDTELYYSITTFTAPTTVYSFDVKSGESKLYLRPEVAFNPDDFTTEQIFFTSKDGTRVPMFVSYKKGLKRNGKNPCYLYGYGGFQINLTPSFSPSSIMFMEQGGVYVFVTLRGGLEYGEKWHKAGMLENKQNVFDDFIAAAEYLIENKYTSSKKLAIAGGSNGGLLVGACEVQRPDLYAVCLPSVGVMDMLRYHKFTIGWGWVVEYGSSDNQEQFEYIYKYSPLHNIKKGEKYPATLITTADHDDRVVPAHSFKFAAQMQYAQAGDAPILIRIETKAGHGAGKPTSKRIEEAADSYAFLFQNTNTPYVPVTKR
ncbi:MAG TPA: prolyl oligopeptidase family serine peptidase [Candidatus Barnesiella excrementigallinarum]|nr:prolyl oligopeptidase family serine peptidase [Candidatus Barnesiella excrementigallinarum]